MAISDELKNKIDSYEPDQAARDIAAQTRFLLIAGPAGSGKTAITSKLLESDDYRYIVSHTTRQPRAGEQEGQSYYFIDDETMAKMIDEKRFIEVETIYGQYASGTSLSEVRQVKDNGKIGVSDIDVAGVKTYMELNPNARAVFILPPSYEEWIRRLAERNEDQDSIKRQLQTAQSWLESALGAGHFRFVINTQLEQAVSDIKDYAQTAEPNSGGSDDTRVEHAWHVLGELKRQLNS